MAQRCEAQGPPHIEYHPLDVVANKSGRLVVCYSYHIHHGFGVNCHVEGPCPHDISYWGYGLTPTIVGVERAWRDMGDYRQLRTGWERVTTLSVMSWSRPIDKLLIPESGDPAIYLAHVDPPGEWEKLWKFYPPRPGRRGRPPGRRLEGL